MRADEEVSLETGDLTRWKPTPCAAQRPVYTQAMTLGKWWKGQKSFPEGGGEHLDGRTVESD